MASHRMARIKNVKEITYSCFLTIGVAFFENWLNAKQNAAIKRKKSSMKPTIGPSKSTGIMRNTSEIIKNKTANHLNDTAFLPGLLFMFLFLISMMQGVILLTVIFQSSIHPDLR